jgi:hypothetical protein
LYGVLEGYFLRVSRFYGDELPDKGWRRVLIEIMARELPGVRPALLSNEAMLKLVLELMKFRRYYLNLAGEPPDTQRTAAMQRTVWQFLELFPMTHRAFTRKLALLVP